MQRSISALCHPSQSVSPHVWIIQDIENMIYEIRHQHITSFTGRYPTVQCIHIDDPSITERFAKELSADRQLEMALTHVFSGKKLFVYAIYTKRGDNYEIVLSNEFKSEYCCSDHSSSRTITKVNYGCQLSKSPFLSLDINIKILQHKQLV